jgi:hypothetical protein
MSLTLLSALTLFAKLDVLCSLGLAAAGLAVLGVAGGGWWTNANNARNATGGPVKPATTRDYILVTLFMTLGVACMLVGLWFMKK